jgi:glycine/D-amino acid oxidase-like deaminating enzyme
MHVAVVGAGAFGGWTALHLLRGGARVTLLDAWGPGNSRASSGDETRIIRALYADAIYVELTVRAMQLWREQEQRWNQQLFRRTGFLRMMAADNPVAQRSQRLLADAGVGLEVLSRGEAESLFPEIRFDGIDHIYHEPSAGYLLARRGCQKVVESFQAEGGEYRQCAAGPVDGLRSVRLSDGTTLTADAYVFACGPWLGQMFPEAIGDRIAPKRCEVRYFGLPPGFDDHDFPCWWDNVNDYYGVPGNEWRGFKVGEDAATESFDPTCGDRMPREESLGAMREFLAMRFPTLAGAPVLESRVCQYEMTPDRNLIVDRHPQADHVFLAGGGSGHGYKLGAALGERIAEIVLGKRALDPFFSLKRLP